MKQLNFLSLVSDNVSGMHRDWTGNGPALPRKLFTLLFCLLLGFGQMWGTTYTLGWGDASGAEGTYTNFNSASGSVTNLVSFSTAKNSAGNAPATGSNPNTLRMYYASNGSGGSVTLTPATGVTITGFSINTTTNPTTKYKVGSGSLTTISLSGSSSNYSGSVSNLSVTSSSSITIQNCNTSNTQLRIKTITITYTAAASCTDPSILLSISSSNTATYGIDKTLETSGGNNGTVTWTVANGTGSATVSGNTLHPTSVGTVTVTATQDDITLHFRQASLRLSWSRRPVLLPLFRLGGGGRYLLSRHKRPRFHRLASRHGDGVSLRCRAEHQQYARL